MRISLLMLCYLAHQFPPFVENFLERGRTLRRRFREETITDLMMGSLITAGTGRVIVEFPDEPVTGADMEWNFVNPGDGTFFRILLQAKQAYGDGTKWTRHGYRELLHTSGTGTKLQAETLCDTARIPGSATYPLYIFYHPAQTCALARKAGMIHVAGVNLADGYVIERLVKAAKTRAFRTSNKSLRVIAPHLFPMSASSVRRRCCAQGRSRSPRACSRCRSIQRGKPGGLSLESRFRRRPRTCGTVLPRGGAPILRLRAAHRSTACRRFRR